MGPDRFHRRFGLRDALILIAATGLGCAILRSLSDIHGFDQYDAIHFRNSPISSGVRTALRATYNTKGPPPSAQRLSYIRYWAQCAAFWPGPLLAGWSLGVLMIALLSSSRERSRLFLRPGVIASVAMVAASVGAAVVSPTILIVRGASNQPLTTHWLDWWEFTWLTLSRIAGYSVALAWLVLIVSNRWCANRGWIDRLGRLLGSCWIGAALMSLLASRLLIY